MARIHYWQFLSDTDGSAVESAEIGIFLAGTETPAKIYLTEIGGEAIETAPQLKSSSVGFFEFWIGDESEKSGYSSTQKFKLCWSRIGIAEGFIDYIDIFPPTLPVDETSDEPTKNKTVSNKLAKLWTTISNSIEHEMFGIREINLSDYDKKRNKLISNAFGKFWNEHRLFNFNKDILLTGKEKEDEIYPWENKDSELFGPHGIQEVNENDVLKNSVKNKLISNYLCNKFNSHTELNLKNNLLNDIYPHGLENVNIGKLPENPTEEEIKNWENYNKLVSNDLINNIINTTNKRASLFVQHINEEDWALSRFERNIYFFEILHTLNSKFLNFTFYKKVERINSITGIPEIFPSVFFPEDIFIIDNNKIEIQVTTPVHIDIVIIAQKDLNLLEH